MSALLDVILPVFVVIGAGYLAARRGMIGPEGIDGLMHFAQGFAIPCLLFRALATLDLGAGFDPALLGSFYAGSTLCFLAGLFGARLLFGREWEDAVAIGFVALFSNSVLLGLPITERAFGPEALAGNFAIVAIHPAFCYAVGIAAMEMVRARGAGAAAVPGKVLRAMAGNALVVGILLGLAVNLSGLPLPGVLWEGIDLLIRAGIPAALFGLGGVLARYRPEGDMPTILFVVALSLVLHPALTWGFGWWAGLGQDGLRSAVVTASMPPGANTYLFAAMYARAQRVAASAVILGTALSVLSAAAWLSWLR